MLRFLPAAVLSFALWALMLQGAQMAFSTVNQFFGSVGGLLSVAFLN